MPVKVTQSEVNPPPPVNSKQVQKQTSENKDKNRDGIDKSRNVFFDCFEKYMKS